MLALLIPLLLIAMPILAFILGEDFSFLAIALFFDVILASLSIRIVRPNEVKTVEFLGKYNRTLRSGLNFIVPVFEITRPQVLFRQNFPVEVSGVTGDNVTAFIGLNVIFFVKDDANDTVSGNIYKSLYSIDDPKNMMRSAIDEQLRAMMVSFTHKDIFGKREEIGEAIEERLREKLSQFGYTLDSIQVRDVTLEANVMNAMNKIVETEKLKEAAFNEAEAKKILQVKEAEAEKEAKILLGEGMAGQRFKIAQGFKESVDLIRMSDTSLTGEKILEFLLNSSRIETLGNIGAKDNAKLIYLNENLEGSSLSKEGKLFAGSGMM